MSEPPLRPDPASTEGEPADALIRRTRNFSIVWIVPIVAALAAIFVAWRAISEQGPTVTLLFDDAEGLEVEKTKVKYKSVDIGVVEAISFTRDLEQVELEVSLVNGSEPFLTENTRFWIVRAEISAGHVSGIGTVLSGAYIAVDLSDEGKRQTTFVGLEKAPVITSEAEGTTYSLRSEAATSLRVGSPVYYRSYDVGKVIAYELDESAEFFSIDVYVRKPYDAQVNTSTKFWNASGLDVSVTAEGVRVDTPSLVSALIGGVSFDNFDHASLGRPVAEGTIFDLYENRDESQNPVYRRKQRYLVYFDRSVAGLTIGAPVEFRGIQIGRVLDVKLTYDYGESDFRIPVVLELEPDRIEAVGNPEEDAAAIEAGFAGLVRRGLRAQLATGNILTGQLKVMLGFHEDAEPADLIQGERYPVIPSAPGAFDQISNSLASVVGELQEVPIADIGRRLDGVLAELQTAVKGVNELTGTLNEDVAPSLTATLESVERTLASTDTMVGPDSAANTELDRIVLDLGDAARSLRLLTERLEQHPEDLLRGKR